MGLGPSSASKTPRSPRYFCKVSGGLAKTSSEKQLGEKVNDKGMTVQLYQEFLRFGMKTYFSYMEYCYVVVDLHLFLCHCTVPAGSHPCWPTITQTAHLPVAPAQHALVSELTKAQIDDIFLSLLSFVLSILKM